MSLQGKRSPSEYKTTFLSGWFRRQCFSVGGLLSGLRLQLKVERWSNLALSVVCRDVLEAAAPGQQISAKGRLKSCTWRRQRSVIHKGCDVRQSGRGIRAAAWVTVIRQNSDDHTMAAALVFLFSHGLWWRWTFLFLEFPWKQKKA